MSLDILLSTTPEVLDTILTHLRPYQRESFLYGVGQRTLDPANAVAAYEEWAQEYGPVFTAPSTLGSDRIVLCDPKAIAHFYSKETWTYIQTPLTKKLLECFVGKGLLWAHGEDHKRLRKALTPAFSIAAIRQLTSILYDSAYKFLVSDLYEYDHPFKAKGAWDVLIESSGGDSTVIEVQNWMNHISLDTIGLAGFSHDFGALEGKHATVTEVFDTFGASPHLPVPLTVTYSTHNPYLDAVVHEILRVHPPGVEVQNWMNHISLDTIGLAGFSHDFGALDGKDTAVTEVFDTFGASPRSALNTGLFLLAQAFTFLSQLPKELEMGIIGGKEERSIIGLLIEGASGDSEFHMTKEEVIAQIKVLLVAGYETTASIQLECKFPIYAFFMHRLTPFQWALLELSRNPDVQTKLRNELLEHGADPTYDQLSNCLPYLDAVIHEILRLHPPVVEITRMAIEDDVVPLSEPVRTKSGELVDSLTIAKGTLVTIPMESMNRSAAIWGEDARVFRPSRWLENAHSKNGIPAKAKEVQGHRHLLTFVDGPRTCLGKNFAVTEFKAVLSVLVKNFVFELRDGVDSKIEIGMGILPRPKIAGEVGCKLPLRVRPYVA
ncbi:cytochrome P450 [Boletus coccyginus]|nr:cytochrome P450 [Boletus coccyginus]